MQLAANLYFLPVCRQAGLKAHTALMAEACLFVKPNMFIMLIKLNKLKS
jgi:hypothetical protein